MLTVYVHADRELGNHFRHGKEKAQLNVCESLGPFVDPLPRALLNLSEKQFNSVTKQKQLTDMSNKEQGQKWGLVMAFAFLPSSEHRGSTLPHF